MANSNLSNAKNKKFDEFYTLYPDIEKEMQAYLEYDADVFRGKTVLLPCDDPEWSNFTKYFALHFKELGLHRLISTSFAQESKSYKTDWQPTLFETTNPIYDADRSKVCGKIFTLDHDANADGRIDIDDLEWTYLEGTGDFRSDEVTQLRDEADIIITNPPFSLWREFFAWVMEGKKQFVIIGNMNAITYKEVFPAIKENRAWLGATGFVSDMVFAVPEGTPIAPADKAKAERLGYVGDYTRLGNSCWFTNIDHGRRHQPLSLMTKADVLRFSKHKELKGREDFLHYDNYNAIEVPFTDSIPSDYDGVMGVPISFLDKYCPEQFELVGATESEGKGFSNGLWNAQSAVTQPVAGGGRIYKRLFIKHKNTKLTQI